MESTLNSSYIEVTWISLVYDFLTPNEDLKTSTWDLVTPT